MRIRNSLAVPISYWPTIAVCVASQWIDAALIILLSAVQIILICDSALLHKLEDSAEFFSFYAVKHLLFPTHKGA